VDRIPEDQMEQYQRHSDLIVAIMDDLDEERVWDARDKFDTVPEEERLIFTWMCLNWCQCERRVIGHLARERAAASAMVFN